MHCKRTFNDNRHMNRFLIILDGEAKKAVKTINTTSGILNATALKTLKKRFWESFIDTTFLPKNFVWQTSNSSKQQLYPMTVSPSTKIDYYMSVSYKIPIFLSENWTKAIICLPYQLHRRFYKFTEESNWIDGGINLVTLEKWLKDQLKTSFSSLTDININKEHMLENRYQIAKLTSRHSIHSLETDININSVKYTSHGSKDKEILKEGKTDNTRTLSYWLCNDNHRLMNCKDFLPKTPVERNNFVFDNKLCFNCLSKEHQLNDYKSDFRCREDNCNHKHHTLLHQELKLEI